jgi:nucleoside-diphosphate-sugar epimerase
MKQTIFIVGGAGYVGEMLCEQLGKRDDVEAIITIDKEAQSDYSKALPKVTYIQANMADTNWQEEVAGYNPTIVIHTAWQIRAMYGEAAKEWHWNVDGSQNIFTFSFATTSVDKLIYFSTASSYAARPDNTIDHRFTELEGFRADDYIYAKEKRVTEENLKALFDARKEKNESVPQVFVVRPAAITGPRGRFMRIRFGLQSALSGNLKGGFINKVITTLTAFVPATKGWVRQFIHEDDVTDIVTKFSFEDFALDYQVFNITPEGDPVLATDMAQAVGKKILPIQPWMARTAFFFFWHATQGKVPTCPGSWRFYSYPVVMSGAKLATVYQCKYSSKEAFRYTDGRYEDWVPQANKNPKGSQQ